MILFYIAELLESFGVKGFAQRSHIIAHVGKKNDFLPITCFGSKIFFETDSEIRLPALAYLLRAIQAAQPLESSILPIGKTKQAVLSDDLFHFGE